MPEWKELGRKFPDFADAARWLPMLPRHLEMLQLAEERVNATAVDDEAAPRRLFAESLETLRIALEHCEGDVGRYADVGSGGGFPGLVAAIVFPNWETTLIEASGRKATLLRDIADELGLNRVTVLHARAEDAGRGPLRDTCDLVTAKAVAELRVVLEYTAPLARDGGLIALPKGSRLQDEEQAAEGAMREMGVQRVARVAMRREVSATPWTLVLRKAGPTPERYPRRPGLPAKRPL